MKRDSILIISNDGEIGAQITDKIKLLRECDTIKTVSYIEAISVLNSTQPSMIIVYSSNNDSIGIIKEIRAIKSLDKVPIVFVIESLVEEILMSAFDSGIDDFFCLSDSDAIILMRILLTLQKGILYKQIDICNEILASAGIVDKPTGIYKKEQAHLALRNFFSQSMEENLENTTFMYLKPLPLEGQKLNLSHIARVVKSVPRGSDIVAYGKSNGFYLILYNAGIHGAQSVSSRIRNILVNDCKIYAIAAEITAPFEEMEPILYKGLQDQINEEKEFNYLYDLAFNKLTEVVDIRDENGKKFKDFKKEFYNSFEKMIAPVFYQVQTANADIFPNANINFSINESESRFSISQEDLVSEVIITYPAYIKLLMDIKHTQNDQSPYIRRLTYDFEDFSAEKLTSILKDVIQEFADRLNMKMMNA